MRDWWKAVERRTKARYSNGGDADDIRDVPIDGPVSRNSAVDDLLVG